MEKASLKKSSLSITRIQKSIGNLSKNLAKTRSTALKINKSLIKNTAFKRKSAREQQRLFVLRRNNVRRKLREDVVEAGKGLAGVVARTGKVVRESTKGFFGRLLDYFGLILVGWLIRNLPMILDMATTLIKRVQKLFTILNDWKDGLLQKLNGMKDLIGALITNIAKFDFTDQSGKIGNAMDKINDGSKKMEQNFDKMLEIFRNPLAYFFPGPQEDPDDIPDDLSGVGTKEQQALLQTIRFAEGTTGPEGYSTFFGGSQYGGDLTEKSVSEVEELVTQFLAEGRGKFTDSRGREQQSAAVGAYQFIDIIGLAKSVGMSTDRKFDKAFQDELALKLAEKRGVDAEKLRMEGLSDDVIKRLSPVWAAFPGNDYGQPTKEKDVLKERYELSRQSRANVSRKQPGVDADGRLTVTRDEINVSGPKGGTPSVGLSGGGGNYNASRDGGKRRHQGIDIGTSGQRGWHVGARIDGTVTYTGPAGGYGKLVIIKDSGGREYYFAHLHKIYVKTGEKYFFGRTIGEIGNTGNSKDIHLHFEVRENGADVDPKPFLNLLSIGKELVDVDKQGNLISKSTTSPEISSIPTNDVVSKITTERKGQTIAMAMPSSGGGGSEQPESQPSSGGSSGGSINTGGNTMDNLLRLNILNELAYT